MVQDKSIGCNDGMARRSNAPRKHLVALGALLLPRLGGPATRALLDELDGLMRTIEHLHDRIEVMERGQREHAATVLRHLPTEGRA